MFLWRNKKNYSRIITKYSFLTSPLELAPEESKFFSFKMDLFQKGHNMLESKQEVSHKSHPPLKMVENLPNVKMVNSPAMVSIEFSVQSCAECLDEPQL